MKQQNMTVLFYLNKAKTNQKRVCPIYCRITYLKKRKQFSTGVFINANNWQSKKQIVKSDDKNHEIINGQLQLVKSKIDKAYLSLLLKSDDFTSETILDTFLGKSTKEEIKVLQNFKDYLKELKKLVGRDLKEATYKKFNYVFNDVKAFIKYKYQQNDFLLRDLTQQFLDDFEHYLKTVKNQKQITINKEIQRFRKAIKVAISKGYLDIDPFLMFKAKRVKKEIIFLTPKELLELENHEFTQPRLKLVKDLFIFSCYTGLAYHEISILEYKHITDGFDENKWIHMKREKTSLPFSVPLLPKPLSLICEYQNENLKVFPVLSNQKYNSYLKEIAGILNIQKNLTTHTARKTFASTVLLYNDVPMEIVSELLGHSSMQVTQNSYAKVVREKISQEIMKLKPKLKN